MIETARFDENRSHRGTSLRNSEHLQQEDTSSRFQREREREKARGRGEERSSTKVLGIMTAFKQKLEWRNAFKIPKENRVQP